MENKFIVDFMLGRLCRWLRLMGFDAQYYRGSDKGTIIYRSLKERRIILTRDTGLSRKRALGIFIVRSDDFRQQLKEIISEFGLDPQESSVFTRCLECNKRLESIPKKRIKGRVPDYVFENHDEFSICSDCQKIYWKGTHRTLIKNVLGELTR
ncbi:MAG: Mut7-C RNAse domain-containing protein [Elusimicrobia bacterium]|nr:Mut7-C RNAse domain-containing protein [Elusimicrobiota bacterium]